MSRLAGQAICTRVLRGPRHIRVPHFTSSASVDADSAGGGVDEVAQQPAAAILPIVGGVSGVPIVSHYLALSNSTGGRFTRFPHLLMTPDPKHQASTADDGAAEIAESGRNISGHARSSQGLVAHARHIHAT